MHRIDFYYIRIYVGEMDKMSNLTKQEKIEIAKAEVEQAQLMLNSSRKQVQAWIDRLEVREEYLEQLIITDDNIPAEG